MRLATLRTPGGTRAVRVDGATAVEIGPPDVGALLADPHWRARADAASGPTHDTQGADRAPLVPRPGKIICVGLNYRAHILEMGRPLPQSRRCSPSSPRPSSGRTTRSASTRPPRRWTGRPSSPS